jgi:hypothetical protein
LHKHLNPQDFDSPLFKSIIDEVKKTEVDVQMGTGSPFRHLQEKDKIVDEWKYTS